MRRHFWPILIALFVSIAIAAASHGAEFRVGASSAAVNPPDGTFLAGYGMNRSSVGVHDDLYAKAVAFDDGTSRVVLLVVDSIGIQYDTVCAIREAAVKLVDGLKPEQVIVQSTHTHCGPDVIGIWG
ncbi:MAG: hypothetical protein QG656_524 [Candidatus Hydrogenedentes bacterium]|nr:hypothetical protein [Candidatus Hydrogenedentota bacterium]